MVAFLEKLLSGELGGDATGEQRQAKNLQYLREESMAKSSKTSSIMTAGAQSDGERYGVDGPPLTAL